MLTEPRLSAVYAQTGNTAAGSAVIAMIFLFYVSYPWSGIESLIVC